MVRADAVAWLANQNKRYAANKVVKITDASIASFEKATAQGCLFHGSPIALTGTHIKPHQTRLHDTPVVFAGEAWVGLCFTAIWTDGPVGMGAINQVPYFQIHDRAVLKEFQKGGWVYQVPPIGFSHTERLADFEYIATEPVEILSRIFVPDPLQLLQELGVDLTIFIDSAAQKKPAPIYTRW